MKRSISFRPTLLALVLATTFPVAHAAVPKDMLVIGKAADPQTLDPAVTIDNNDWTVTYPSYQRLVQYKTDGDKGSTDVEGDLASSWKATEWVKVITTLRLATGVRILPTRICL
ncbi:putative ABC transporter periplasmic-binding protein yddS [Shigella sonnei]|nr:putative ABC transporter periplasmic-binding protein yddS [Shigella sonnei]